MQLVEIVQTSQCVAETRARLEKIGHLADCMGRLTSEEREAGVAFLAGEMRQVCGTSCPSGTRRTRWRRCGRVSRGERRTPET